MTQQNKPSDCLCKHSLVIRIASNAVCPGSDLLVLLSRLRVRQISTAKDLPLTVVAIEKKMRSILRSKSLVCPIRRVASFLVAVESLKLKTASLLSILET